MQESNITVTSSSATTPTSKSTASDKASSNEDGTGRNGVNSSPSTNTSASTPTNPSDIDQAKFEADKRSIYKHPLFSLLALLLEKCEQATQGYLPSSTSSNSSSASSPNGSTNGQNNNESDSFSRDIQAFVQLIEKEKRPLLTNNSELDGLMIKALQVLRIHLLELEKVQELCRDFCTRYIACLRGKMQSENLLRSDYAMEHMNNNNLSNSNSPINSPADQETLSNQPNFFGNGNSNNDFLANTTEDFASSNGNNNSTNNNSNHGFSLNHSSHHSQSSNNGLDNSNGGSINLTITDVNTHLPVMAVTGNTTVTSGGGLAGVTHPHQISGSTPISQIGCPPINLEQYSAQLSPSCGDSEDDLDSELESNTDDIGSNYSLHSSSKRQKRGILPKHATSVMRAWLFQHLVHPYPTEDEKRAIAAQTNLTLLQVNNWFINARRRILQPMLEHASDSSLRKKSSPEQQHDPSSSPPKRFWAEQLAATQLQGQLPLDANIENISANINRMDSERLLAVVTAAQQKLQQNFYSSDESNDESLVIDHEN